MSEEIKDVHTRGALVAIAVAVLVIALLSGVLLIRQSDFGSRLPNDKQFQAVFLTNGDVYYGRLTGLGGDRVTIKNAFVIVPSQVASPSPSPGLSLVAADNLVHGPEKDITVASDEVVFWENLRDDSQVTKRLQEQIK